MTDGVPKLHIGEDTVDLSNVSEIVPTRSTHSNTPVASAAEFADVTKHHFTY